ncbi:hypothetical protein ACCO45_013117 [Purpureocillium lilacinum]|uniref:Uncharacterized protein n=1 Tax=Purpureocillium lilacinum TaxID=33203 RepID=A0ACC4DC47_PURLI
MHSQEPLPSRHCCSNWLSRCHIRSTAARACKRHLPIAAIVVAGGGAGTIAAASGASKTYEYTSQDAGPGAHRGLVRLRSTPRWNVGVEDGRGHEPPPPRRVQNWKPGCAAKNAICLEAGEVSLEAATPGQSGRRGRTTDSLPCPKATRPRLHGKLASLGGVQDLDGSGRDWEQAKQRQGLPLVQRRCCQIGVALHSGGRARAGHVLQRVHERASRYVSRSLGAGFGTPGCHLASSAFCACASRPVSLESSARLWQPPGGLPRLPPSRTMVPTSLQWPYPSSRFVLHTERASPEHRPGTAGVFAAICDLRRRLPLFASTPLHDSCTRRTVSQATFTTRAILAVAAVPSSQSQMAACGLRKNARLGNSCLLPGASGTRRQLINKVKGFASLTRVASRANRQQNTTGYVLGGRRFRVVWIARHVANRWHIHSSLHTLSEVTPYTSQRHDVTTRLDTHGSRFRLPRSYRACTTPDTGLAQT